MQHGEPLARYFLNRLQNLYRRRYKPHHKRLNAFLNGAALTQRPPYTPTKTPVHFEIWLLDPAGKTKPLWGGPTEKIYYWGVYYSFRYYDKPRVETKGYLKIDGDLINLYSSSWNDNLLVTAGGNSWDFELADPDCIEKVVAKFKRMFPIPQVRK